MASCGVVFIEPFYGGSHKQLMDLLVREIPGDLYTLPATKWHWRMRTSALHFSMVIPRKDSYRSILASSILNLCELVSLRPDFAKLHKVLYFHENQLVYPVRKHQDRDFQYGYNEILSCLVADTILFNSHFNMNSFLDTIDSFLKLIPDHRPKGLADSIRGKCSVLYFPLELQNCEPIASSLGCTPLLNHKGIETDNKDSEPATDSVERESIVDHRDVTYPQNIEKSCEEYGIIVQSTCQSVRDSGMSNVQAVPITDSVSEATHTVLKERCPLHIVWPHRWEHDKGPLEFTTVITNLLDANLDFRVSVLGAHTNDIPVQSKFTENFTILEPKSCVLSDCLIAYVEASFSSLFPLLGSRLLHKGHVPKSVYWDVLRSADVVVSTAKHEFFGVAMLEAVASGCYPLCPNRLVYPEFYPEECLYNTEHQLFKRLKRFCLYPNLARAAEILEKMPVIELFKWENLKMKYSEHLNAACTD